MYEKFNQHFHADNGVGIPASACTASDLIRLAGGASFNEGLYRIHTEASSRLAHGFVRDAFPAAPDGLTCFSFDWLGNQFVVGPNDDRGNNPRVLFFEIESGSCHQAPERFNTFHDEFLAEFTEGVLHESGYRFWLDAGGGIPKFNECVGYRIPLGLSGAQSVANMELIDMDVYWTLTGQLQFADISFE